MTPFAPRPRARSAGDLDLEAAAMLERGNARAGLFRRRKVDIGEDTQGSSPPSASTSPQGDTIRLCP